MWLGTSYYLESWLRWFSSNLVALVTMSTSPALKVRADPYMKCKLVQCVDRTGSKNWPHIISHSWHPDDMHLTPSGIIWPRTHQRPSFGNPFMMALSMNYNWNHGNLSHKSTSSPLPHLGSGQVLWQVGREWKCILCKWESKVLGGN
jgi:hypothetical protein